MDVLEEAWETGRRNGGSPGDDGITIKATKMDIDTALSEIQTELKSKTYEP